MRGGLRTLQRLATVATLSEFCRVADRKGLIDEVSLVYEASQLQYLLRQDFTKVMTAALVRGLDLFVSSSTGSSSVQNNLSNHTSATADLHQTTESGASCQADSSNSSRALQHSQSILPVTAACMACRRAVGTCLRWQLRSSDGIAVWMTARLNVFG